MLTNKINYCHNTVIVLDYYGNAIFNMLVKLYYKKEISFMENKEKDTLKKVVRVKSSIVLYIAGSVVAIMGIALLVTNVMYFNTLVGNYVSQGYTTAAVYKQLVPSQLLPAIFNSIGIYGGISVLLIGAGIINKKVTKVTEATEVDEIATDIKETATVSE